ncbi:MAG: hypothetical protein N2999_01410 [Proteobacteria bacterium]|nr:hypothetical protein [Pseudomonadota bacterium]
MEEYQITEITQRIISVTDRKLRAFILSEKFQTLNIDEIKDFLEKTVIDVFENKTSALQIVFTFVDILERVYEIEIKKSFYEKLEKISTENKILNLLIDPPLPHKFLKRGEVHTTDIMMDYLPLGIKRSFAKKLDRILIRRMLLEKDPYVVKYLLSNPIITEKDVLKIASGRPTKEEVIKVIYTFDKWINLYSVKEAIVKNPYSPFRLSLLMLFFMQQRELRTIHSDNTLHPVIREIAKEIIDRRNYLK